MNCGDEFGLFQGYIGDKDNFNGVIFLLRESHTEEVKEFWFWHIVNEKDRYFERLREDPNIRRNKISAAKFENRFKEILKQIGKAEDDIHNIMFWNLNSKGGGSSVSGEYKELLPEAAAIVEGKIRNIDANQREIIIFTCSDIYGCLRKSWNVESEKEGNGLCYSNGKQLSGFECELEKRRVKVYEMYHPSRSPGLTHQMIV